MLDCDGEGCHRSGHMSCAGLTAVPEGSWLCPDCSDSTDEAMEMAVSEVDDGDEADVEEEAAAQAAQAAGKTVWWKNGRWMILGGQWFCLKRWLGDDVADSFSNLSRQQAVALLDGFCRADDEWSSQFDEMTGAPVGRWRCSSSSFPLINHLQLIGQLAGATVDLCLANEADSSKVVEGLSSATHCASLAAQSRLHNDGRCARARLRAGQASGRLGRHRCPRLLRLQGRWPCVRHHRRRQR